jgi:hypothetical protein
MPRDKGLALFVVVARRRTPSEFSSHPLSRHQRSPFLALVPVALLHRDQGQLGGWSGGVGRGMGPGPRDACAYARHGIHQPSIWNPGGISPASLCLPCRVRLSFLNH